MQECRACGERGLPPWPVRRRVRPRREGLCQQIGSQDHTCGAWADAGQGRLGSSSTSMLWDDPWSGQTLPRNHGCPAVRGAASRRVCSQGNPPLLAPRVSATDNSILFGCLWPPRLLLLSHKRGCSLPSTMEVCPGATATCWVRAVVSPPGGCSPSWLGSYLPRGAEEGEPSPVKWRRNSEMWVLASPYRVLAA